MEPITANTYRLSAGEPAPLVTVSEIAWLSGHWRGPGLGGVCEEVWSPPAGGAMMGMFRFLQDDQVIFYEFLTIVEAEGTLILRLKHFQPDLIGWEEKDRTVDFPLVGVTDESVFFERMTFRREGDDHLTISLAMKDREGAAKEMTFAYVRGGNADQ